MNEQYTVIKWDGGRWDGGGAPSSHSSRPQEATFFFSAAAAADDGSTPPPLSSPHLKIIYLPPSQIQGNSPSSSNLRSESSASITPVETAPSTRSTSTDCPTLFTSSWRKHTLETMASSRLGIGSWTLILGLILIVLPGQAAAFGAGNIPSIAQVSRYKIQSCCRRH
jgi:hypothetical protein